MLVAIGFVAFWIGIPLGAALVVLVIQGLLAKVLQTISNRASKHILAVVSAATILALWLAWAVYGAIQLEMDGGTAAQTNIETWVMVGALWLVALPTSYTLNCVILGVGRE